MRSVGKPSADSSRVAATSVYTSGFAAPYFTLTLSPPGSSQSNFGVVPDIPSGLKRHSTVALVGSAPGPGGLSLSFAASIGTEGGVHTCARLSASSWRGVTERSANSSAAVRRRNNTPEPAANFTPRRTSGTVTREGTASAGRQRHRVPRARLQPCRRGTSHVAHGFSGG